MDTNCTYRGNREEMLIAYLYDAADAGDRAAFDAHLSGCITCREELAELRLVRTELAAWAPPEPAAGWLSDHATYGKPTVVPRTWGSMLRELPVWAQVAAAMLILGVSAGAANLHVTYGDSGLTVRTGWLSSPRPAPETIALAPAATLATTPASADTAPWRAELVSFEQQLRSDLKPGAVRDDVSDQAIMRRVRALIDESEKKQQRELALRLAETANQRVAELRSIDRNFSGTAADMRLLYQQQQELMKRVALVR